MEDNEKKYIDDTREYWAGFPEAPVSDTFKWVDTAGFEHMLTLRAYSPHLLFRQIEKTIAGITDIGGKPVTVRPTAAQPPATDPAAKIAMEEGNKELAAELQKIAAEVPPSRKGADAKYQITEAAVVEVLPQPDEKVTIKFYGDGDKYPRVAVNKWRIEAATGLMKYVTSEPMSKAGKYTLSCRVYWTEGNAFTKEDGSTGHYKDVEHVRPA
jgi:hypothetical protein